MPPRRQGDYVSVIRVLASHRVDVIIVGGVAGVVHGAPLMTFDLDLVHSRSAGNIARLLAALDDLEAYYRQQPERRLRPNASHLVSPGHQLLDTRFGYVDFLGSIWGERTYEDLVPHSELMEIEPGLRVRVLDLPTLIAVKEHAGREKDLAVLPTLRHTLEEKRRLAGLL